MIVSDSVKKLFDSVLGEPLRANPFSLESIRESQGISDELENFGSPTNEITSDVINSIAQSNSKGFRVLDINPNLLSRADFYCVYQDTILREYVGDDNLAQFNNFFGFSAKYDNEGDFGVCSKPEFNTEISCVGAGGVWTPGPLQSIQNPYWRTVSIPIVGNFLKIEYLPVRQNVGGGYVVPPNDTSVESTVDPQNTLEFTSGVFPGSSQIAGTGLVLIDFENPSANPLIAKNGDVFKTPFTQVFITFKQLSPRIRITIGYNSEIVESKNDPQSLSIWDGKSLTRNSLQAPKQFCIDSRDNGSLPGYALQTTAAGGFFTVELVRGFLPGLSVPNGLGVLWIDDFKFMISNNGGNTYRTWDFELMIAENLGGGLWNFLERVSSGRCLIDTARIELVQPEFKEAKRIVLRETEALVLRCTAIENTVNAQVTSLRFQMSGYSHGSLIGFLDPFTGHDQVLPFRFFRPLTENPYATDLERFGVPGG